MTTTFTSFRQQNFTTKLALTWGITNIVHVIAVLDPFPRNITDRPHALVVGMNASPCTECRVVR